MDDELLAEIATAIRHNCFYDANAEEVRGIDYAASAILKIFERETEESYRSTVLDMTTRG